MATSPGRSAGPTCAVTSILSNPDQDPHLFEASPSVARAISAARIVVYSGIDYDPWMEKLLSAAQQRRPQDHRRGRPGRAEDRRQPAYLVRPGDHAGACARTLGGRSGADRSGAPRRIISERLAQFRAVAASRSRRRSQRCAARSAGTPVTATEPVFGYMFEALGMQVRNMPFQMAVMNNTEPERSDVAAFENDLQGPSGQAAGLQQPGLGPDRRAHGAAGQGVAASRSSARPRPSRPARPTRRGC